MAYVIPDPRRPRMCIPVPSATVALLPPRTTPAFVRHELEQCPVVDGVRWPVWQIEGKQMVIDLFAALLP